MDNLFNKPGTVALITLIVFVLIGVILRFILTDLQLFMFIAYATPSSLVIALLGECATSYLRAVKRHANKRVV